MELLEGEVFKEIPDYEGLYEVSNKGRIKPLAKKWICGEYGQVRSHPEIIMKQNPSTHGYMLVDLMKCGKRKSAKVHQLVAMCFLDQQKKLPTIDHIDGNQINNECTNLRYCTNRQNMSFDNVKRKRKKASVYTGVYWSLNYLHFYARIKINKKTIHLGYFKNEEDASKAYQNALPKNELK